MLYYKTENGGADAIAARIMDGKRMFGIWTDGETCRTYSTHGELIAVDMIARHADAVLIADGMTEKALKNARRIAATRETLRGKEEKAAALLSHGDSMTAEDRRALLSLVNVAYHSGASKIEGIYSVDGSASCEFCCKMIAAAEHNPLLICGCCYAAADSYKEASWRTHKLNARILSSVLFTAEELKALDIPGPLCRYNEDGDTVNVTHARNLLRIAETRPGVSFGYWYKNAAAVIGGLVAEGITTRDALPENVRFIHSGALIGFEPAPLWCDDALFVVYPDDATTADAIAGGAFECNGRRCRACGFHCYLMQRQAAPIVIAEYLRTGAANRARIMDAYSARKAARA